MTQYIKFPMEYMNITQGVNGSYSHQGSNAIDNAGKDTGIDNAFAPFDGIIKKIWPYSNTVWIESVKPVKFADGTTGFCTVSLTHDNDVKNLKIGQKVKQGEVFYQEGTRGNANGNHVHIEVAKGKFTGTGWYKNKYGNWVLNNGIRPEKAFFINGVKVINDYKYNWKKYEEVTMITVKGLNRVTRLRVWRAPTDAEIKKYVGKYTEDQVDDAFIKSTEHKKLVKFVDKNKVVSVQALSKDMRKVFGVKS